MTKNDRLLDEMLTGLQGQQPELKNPDAMLDGIFSRIEEVEKEKELTSHKASENGTSIIALRFLAVAASLLLLFGVGITFFSQPETSSALLSYQSAAVSKTIDSNYIQQKLYNKSSYELIKKQIYENKD